MRTLLDKIGTRWLLIALAVAAVAFVAGVNYGLRTDGGIGAQGVTPTVPPALLNTPTASEVSAMIATAEAIISTPTPGAGLVIEVIDPATNNPVKESAVAAMSKEEAALVAAYETADAKFSEISMWFHSRFDRLTPNLQEYLDTNPDRAIYLQKIDKVIHLPENVQIRWIKEKSNIPSPRLCAKPADGCQTALPAYELALKESQETDRRKRWVLVDSAGYVFVAGSDTLPQDFSFLSKFQVARYK